MRRLFTRKNKQTQKPSWRLVIVSLLFTISSLTQLFTFPAGAAVVSNAGLAIGTYNILGYYHGEGQKYGAARLEQLVSNINSMSFDVVGLQEYKYQREGDHDGFIHALQKLNPSWQMSNISDTDGYDVDQLNFVYNSSSVTLVEDRLIKTMKPTNVCSGGTEAARAGRFTTSTGQEFLVVNVHPTPKHTGSGCDNQRLSTIKGALADSAVAAYTGPVFFIGDFNANPDGKRYDEAGVEKYIKSVGFANSRDIPNASRDSGGGVIDHIYYKTATVSAPSQYESLDCKTISGGPQNYTSKTTCASDHHPVKAVFGDLTGSGGNCVTASTEATSGDEESEYSTNEYRSKNNVLFTGDIGACCNSPAGGAGSLVGDTNAEKLYNFLTTSTISTNNGNPLTPAQAAGVVGNLMVESGESIDPKAINPIGAHGIAQWLDRWDSKNGLKQFAEKKGSSWDALDVQAAFIIYELENTESAVVKDSKFKAVPNSAAGARIAAERWDTLYERSGGAGISARQRHAEQVFNEFAAGSTTATTADPADAADPTTNDTDPADTASTLSSTGQAGCASALSTGSVAKLQELAKAYTQDWATSKTMSQTQPYEDAVKRSEYQPTCPGNDCGSFVYILMHESGWDTNYGGSSGQTAHMRAWFADPSNGWSEVEGLVNVSGSVIDKSIDKLEPGDVLLQQGHIYVFVGNMNGDGTQYFASASNCQRSPAYSTTSDHLKPNTVWRKNGTGSTPL